MFRLIVFLYLFFSLLIDFVWVVAKKPLKIHICTNVCIKNIILVYSQLSTDRALCISFGSSWLACSAAVREWVSMCVWESAKERREGQRQHVHQRATYCSLGSHRSPLSIPPPFLSLPFLLVFFFFNFLILILFFFTFFVFKYLVHSGFLFPLPFLLFPPLMLFPCSSPAFRSCVACWRWHL